MSSLYRKKGLKDSIAIKSLKSIKTQQYDELARIVKNSLDMESIYRIMGVR
jgi:cobyric acid synthase